MPTPLILAAGLLLLGASNPAERVADWQDMARQDVTGVHDALLANHPAVYVNRDSAHFRDWLEAGYRIALGDLPNVHDSRGYYYLLRGYAGGFRDSHIIARVTEASDLKTGVIAWPRVATAWRNGTYVVAYVDPAHEGDLPPMGAHLISCDGHLAKQMARERLDRYEANLELEGGRYFSAPKLLWDLGNPFVGSPPSSCTFGTNGKQTTYRMRYSAPENDLSTVVATAAGRSGPALSVERWKDGWWIGLPSMLGDQRWDEFFANIDRHKEEIRSAPYVVIDVRGNAGGDSEYPVRLATTLWGDAVVSAYSPDNGDEVYRASELNRQFFIDALRRFAASHEVNEYVPEFTDLVSKMNAAITAGQPLVVIHHPPLIRPRTPPANPMMGRIVLLTDYVCNSACLDMMDIYTRIPRAAQAGVSTFADTIFMEVSRADLPSGRAVLAFGHKAWIQRLRGSNVAYRPTPEHSYRGDLGNDTAVRQWVADVVIHTRPGYRPHPTHSASSGLDRS
jgi:Peptidase family S41